MSDTYKLQYDGMTLTYPGWNGYVSYDAPSFKTLTLYNSEGGTLTANKLTGYPGDTINLSTAYNTYWRFSGYQLTGDGSLVGNDYTFGNEDASICACYKKNAFTATGGFDKGSNVNATTSTNNVITTTTIPLKYALHGSHTGDIPASWYSTSNRWKPSNVSAYSITLNPKCTFTAKYPSNSFHKDYNYYTQITAVSLIGNTQTNSQTWTGNVYSWKGNGATCNYNKTFTTTTQNVNYGISGKIVIRNLTSCKVTATYVAANTTGGWTATGYAP